MAMLRLHDLLATSLADFSTASHYSGFIRACIHKFRGAALNL